MSTQKGTLRQIDKNWVWVEIQSQTGCSCCGASLIPKEGRNHSLIKADNQVNADVGDVVLIQEDEHVKMKWLTKLFILPLLPILAAIVLSPWIGKWSGIAYQTVLVGMTLIGILVSFMLIRIVAKRWEKDTGAIPIVIRKLKPPNGAVMDEHRAFLGCQSCSR